ncbi:hypothetical protein COL154_014076, partial [Colletotrichum chrysophilum]
CAVDSGADLVEEDDAVVLDQLDGFLNDHLVVDQLVGFLGHEDLEAVLDIDVTRLGAATERLAQHVVQIDHADLAAGHAGDLEGRHGGAGVGDLDLDLLVVQFAVTQLLAEGIARRGRGGLAGQRFQHALSRIDMRTRLAALAHLLARQADGDLDEVAHDLLDVAADIADLGELGRLDLDEGRTGQFGEPPRDFRLADAGRTDHQDVFRHHLVAQVFGQLLAAPAVPERDRDGALGVLLADDEPVQLRDDFTW